MNDINEFIAAAQTAEDNGLALCDFIQSMTTLASSGKTPLGLNRWVDTDKPKMEDFNQDNEILDREISALKSDKAEEGRLGGITFYTSLAQIGCTPSSTVADVHDAMKENSELITYLEAGSTLVYPYTYGTLTIKKASGLLSEWTLSNHTGGRRWFLAYTTDPNHTGSWHLLTAVKQ